VTRFDWISWGYGWVITIVFATLAITALVVNEPDQAMYFGAIALVAHGLNHPARFRRRVRQRAELARLKREEEELLAQLLRDMARGYQEEIERELGEPPDKT
jgi:hypothetical protein